MDQASKSPRVYFMDELRGLSIILMVIYHAAYNVVYLFHVPFALFSSPVIQFLSTFFGGVFVFISGVACRYSHNNLRRGAICLGFGLIFSIVTYFLSAQVFIAFGILHFLGTSMILYGLLEKWVDRLPALWMICLLSILFLFTFGLPSYYVGIPGIFKIQVSPTFYQNPLGFIVGLPSTGFYSADYYPLVPWIFLFFAGSYVGKYVRAGRFPSFLYREHCPFLSKVGRHTLIIYLLHQPIVYSITWVIFYFLRQ